jgi:hypothetical protein
MAQRVLLPILAAILLQSCGPTSRAAVHPIERAPLPAPSSARVSAVPASSSSPPLPPPPTDKELCALEPAGSASGLPGIHPFTRAEPHCPESDSFCDFVDSPPDPRDTCFVANANISRAERESRGAIHGQPAKLGAWDGATPPRYLDRIDAHFHLTPEEHARLRAHGFVVLDRLAYASYAAAFHDIFQEQLPLYVGIDPILHAVFRGTEGALERVERSRLKPALGSLLKKLRRALGQTRQRYDADALKDLDLYLGVAWYLSGLGGQEEPLSSFGQDDAVRELGALAEGNPGLKEVALFGRPRMIDFSQLIPRGHYESGNPELDLSQYFRSVMWLSRLEFNLVSRSCRSSQPGAIADPRETPREARDAMALADLVERSGASAELVAFESVYSVFAGRREDVSPGELARLMHTHRISVPDREAFDRLKSAIGDGFRRTARIHFMPQGATDLPVIATLIGPRIVPDVAPLTRLVHDSVDGRTLLGAADVAYLLGHDRANHYLASDLAKFPALRPQLDQARRELAEQAKRGRDLYGGWLRSILALGPAPAGVRPSFIGREAYADSRMNSALVGYGQLRHAHVLVAAQGYDAYGCEIPDAYAEPLPAAYDALLAHVRGLRATARGYGGLLRVLGMLRSIVATEVTGAPLSEPERRWLGMVAENVPRGGSPDSGEPPKWTGWYYDLFEGREHGANASTAFVADYFTLTNRKLVAHLGADGPRLGVFVIDVGGEPRAMVGPVASGYEAATPIAERLDDERALTYAQKSADWRKSFAVSRAPEPALGVTGRVINCWHGQSRDWRVAVRTERPAGPLRITLLDHHGDPLSEPLTVTPDPTWRTYIFRLPAEVADSYQGVEAMAVHADLGTGSWDYFTTPSQYRDSDFIPSELPVRPSGVGAFSIGATGSPARSPAELRPPNP